MSTERTLGWVLLAIGVPSFLAGAYLTASGGGVHHLLLTGLGANTMGIVLLDESETTRVEAADAGPDETT